MHFFRTCIFIYCFFVDHDIMGFLLHIKCFRIIILIDILSIKSSIDLRLGSSQLRLISCFKVKFTILEMVSGRNFKGSGNRDEGAGNWTGRTGRTRRSLLPVHPVASGVVRRHGDVGDVRRAHLDDGLLLPDASRLHHDLRGDPERRLLEEEARVVSVARHVHHPGRPYRRRRFWFSSSKKFKKIVLILIMKLNSVKYSHRNNL